MCASQLLVAGATGATGHAAVEALRGSGHVVKALVHSDGPRADTLRSFGAEIVVGDLLDIDSVRAALEGVDGAYFVYPIQQQLLQAAAFFAQAASEAGVGAIVNLSQRTSDRYAGSHAAQNHWIAERVFDRSGVPVTHLRPTLFAEWLLYPFARQGITDHDVLALPFGPGRFAPVTAADQGRVIATILSDPAAHAGRIYQLNGPAVLDGAGIAAALGEGLGRQITYSPVPIAEFQAMAATIPQLGPFFAQHIGAVMADVVDGLLATTDDTVKDITGTAAMSIQDFARSHRDMLTRSASAATST